MWDDINWSGLTENYIGTEADFIRKPEDGGYSWNPKNATSGTPGYIIPQPPSPGGWPSLPDAPQTEFLELEPEAAFHEVKFSSYKNFIQQLKFLEVTLERFNKVAAAERLEFYDTCENIGELNSKFKIPKTLEQQLKDPAVVKYSDENNVSPEEALKKINEYTTYVTVNRYDVGNFDFIKQAELITEFKKRFDEVMEANVHVFADSFGAGRVKKDKNLIFGFSTYDLNSTTPPEIKLQYIRTETQRFKTLTEMHPIIEENLELKKSKKFQAKKQLMLEIDEG